MILKAKTVKTMLLRNSRNQDVIAFGYFNQEISLKWPKYMWKIKDKVHLSAGVRLYFKFIYFIRYILSKNLAAHMCAFVIFGHLKKLKLNTQASEIFESREAFILTKNIIKVTTTEI
jgi:hypothetical protein